MPFPSRDRKENPFERKPIFCGSKITTSGSSFMSQQKKVFEQKIWDDGGK